MKFTSLLFCLLFPIIMNAQDESKLPYHQIPDSYESYSPGNIMARMIDGLGYRFYWATENLSDKDLQYRPTSEASSSMETIQHLYGLAKTIHNLSSNEMNIRPVDYSTMTYKEAREKTLLLLEKASKNFQNKSAEDLEKLEVKFQRGERTNSFPLWNGINGPITDAIYHVGQIVSFRRTTGNPLHPGVSVFSGKTKE